jgi:cytochrome c-type biogenesis protein CcmH/NrfF
VKGRGLSAAIARAVAIAAFVAILLVIWLAGSATRAAANEAASGAKDPARAITSQLICPCSCGEILSGCTCDTGKAMQAFVSDQLRSGKGKEEITAQLVAKYGEVILGAPKARGFNLIVWVAPFLATLIGIVIATIILRRWVHRRAAAPLAVETAGGFGSMEAPRSVEEDLAALRARAEAELRRLRE